MSRISIYTHTHTHTHTRVPFFGEGEFGTGRKTHFLSGKGIC